MHQMRYISLIVCALSLTAGSGCLARTWSCEVGLTRVQKWPSKGTRSERLAYIPIGHSCEFQMAVPHKGPTLLFVHGLGSSKHFWRDMAYTMLAQKDAPAILVDLLGHGHSDKPTAADYSPSAQGRRLARFVHENPRLFCNGVVFVGMSYGASSSLEAVIHLQEMEIKGQESPPVRGVFSVSAPAYYFPGPEEGPDAIKNLESPPFLYRISAPFLSPQVIVRRIEQSVLHPERLSEEDREEVRRQYGSTHFRSRKAVRLATLHMLIELKDNECRQDRFQNVRCQVKVVGGQQDQIVPTRIQERLAQSIPGATLDLIDDCGHAVARDQPAKLLNLLMAFYDLVQ